jgi:sporulation protein YlmC with PRC-barrel domain
MTTTNHPTRRSLSATTLIGDTVRSTDGDKLGSMKEIMIDMETGRTSYAVLDMGGFLGIGNKLFAMPWALVEVDTDNHEIIIDVPKERLMDAPGFDQDNWPDFSDRIWGEGLHSHYGAKPYWN